MSPSYQFTWPQLLGLSELYSKGQTQMRIDSNKYILHRLIRQNVWIQSTGNQNYGWKIPFRYQSQFRQWYVKNCAGEIADYRGLLQTYDLPSDGRRNYSTKDLDLLLLIASQKENILNGIDSVSLEKFSSDFFDGSKYLKDHASVQKAVLKILGLDRFKGTSPRDHLWRLCVDCPDAEVIVLCENMDFLRIPDQALEAKIELWYVGGNNIKAIERISPEKLNLPIFYSCDWDHAGLSIFIRICKKFGSLTIFVVKFTYARNRFLRAVAVAARFGRRPR